MMQEFKRFDTKADELARNSILEIGPDKRRGFIACFVLYARLTRIEDIDDNDFRRQLRPDVGLKFAKILLLLDDDTWITEYKLAVNDITAILNSWIFAMFDLKTLESLDNWKDRHAVIYRLYSYEADLLDHLRDVDPSDPRMKSKMASNFCEIMEKALLGKSGCEKDIRGESSTSGSILFARILPTFQEMKEFHSVRDTLNAALAEKISKIVNATKQFKDDELKLLASKERGELEIKKHSNNVSPAIAKIREILSMAVNDSKRTDIEDAPSNPDDMDYEKGVKDIVRHFITPQIEKGGLWDTSGKLGQIVENKFNLEYSKLMVEISEFSNNPNETFSEKFISWLRCELAKIEDHARKDEMDEDEDVNMLSSALTKEYSAQINAFTEWYYATLSMFYTV